MGSTVKEPQRAWIEVTPAGQESAELLEIYRRYSVPTDAVDHILSIHSLSPGSLQGHLEMYRFLMFGPGPLTRVERETLAVTVSTLNVCHY
jgi:hypothetical protein